MSFKTPWHKNMTKTRLVSEGKIAINRNIQLIQVCIALCPLFGLMGTVTGMIEVFQVMAFNGGGDARSMAGGVKPWNYLWKPGPYPETEEGMSHQMS